MLNFWKQEKKECPCLPVPVPQCYTHEDMRRWKMLVVGHGMFLSSLFSSLFFFIFFFWSLFYFSTLLRVFLSSVSFFSSSLLLIFSTAAAPTWFGGAKTDRQTLALAWNATSNTGRCCEVMRGVSLPAAALFSPFIPHSSSVLLHLEELMLTLQMGFVSSVSLFYFFEFNPSFLPPAACFFPSGLICSFIHVDVHLWTLRRWWSRMSRRCPAAARPSKNCHRQLAAPWTECPRRRRHTWCLPSPVASACVCYKTWPCWSTVQSVCAVSQPPCGVPGSCGGGGVVGGLSECHPVRFWPILNLQLWSRQDLRALKGTLWWCLCYLCECCCRKKRKEKKKWVKQEKPESPQDGQLQQEEVPHVAVTLKRLRKSAHLCVFIRLFKRSRILQI